MYVSDGLFGRWHKILVEDDTELKEGTKNNMMKQ